MDFSDLTKQRKLNDVDITYFGRLGVVYLKRNCSAIYLLGTTLVVIQPLSLFPASLPATNPTVYLLPECIRHFSVQCLAYAVPTCWNALFICLANSYSTFKDQPKCHLLFEASPSAPTPQSE